GNRAALTLLSPTDGRVLFALPAGPHSIIGTTDTYTTATPDDVRASNEDVRYLIDSANAFFPAAQLTGDDVVSAWAGIRPLLPAQGDTPGAASREHAVLTDHRGLISIAGGKLTTYRVMAGDVVDVVAKQLNRNVGSDRTRSLPLPGGDIASLDDVVASAAWATGDPALGTHLARSYGSRWVEVWKEISTNEGAARLVDALPYTVGEMRYAVHREMACTLGDLLIRRTHLAFETRDHGLAVAQRVAALVAPLLEWDDDAKRRAIGDYVGEVERVFSIEEAGVEAREPRRADPSLRSG
ncbi:MAG TPA: FAD-dependent oxidoreductase, partial [Gemmatimonadaceae bacterium]